ncbi:MAG: PAS domain S-box protein, partial [Fidelibacterota bacterium]
MSFQILDIFSSWHAWWAVLIYLALLTLALVLYFRMVTRLDREKIHHQKTQLEFLRQQDEIKTRELKVQNKYRRLFEQSQDAILVADSDGNIVDSNSAAEKLFGYSGEALLNIGYHNLFSVKEELQSFNDRIVQSGHVNDFEITIVDRQGQMKECVISGVSLLDENGNITGYQGIIRDVTRLKNLESELNYLAENL